MRMTSWFESVRRSLGGGTVATSRRRGSGETRQRTAAFVESLESRCLLAAGDLDPSFGVAGRVITTVGPTWRVGMQHAVTVQTDGSIVIAGSTANQSNQDFTIVRYHADGSLDTTFGVAGIAMTDLGGSDVVKGMAIQSDGKIIVIGSRQQANARPTVAVVRYNSDGSLDSSFGGTGIVITSFGYYSEANAVTIQHDGRIVVTGDYQNTARTQSGFLLARYNADGSLDSNFHGTGIVTTDFTATGDIAKSVVVQSDGKIIAAGDRQIERYNSDGSLDASFNVAADLTTLGIRDELRFNTIALDTNGKLVAAGTISSTVWTLARFRVDGHLDTTFGDRGLVTSSLGNSGPNAIAIQGDQKILAVGGFSDFLVVRYNADGATDLTFGQSGFVGTDFGMTVDEADSIAVQDDGKIVVAGSSNRSFATARYFAAEMPPAFTSASSVSVAENSKSTLTVAATDPESRVISFDIAGGADQSKFAINSFTGVMSFVVAPDFENPADVNHDNIYEVQVTASDGINVSQQTIAVAVTDINEPPTIMSASSVSQPENTTATLTLKATDPENGTLTYSLAGGADEASFAIDSTTGALSFKAAPNFESPQDADHNNVYLVSVAVSDGTNAVTQDLQVTVTNVDEPPTIASGASVSVAENSTAVQTVAATDPEGHVLVFGVTGGADQSKFVVNPLTGALSLASPPDFESPTDLNHDNVYEMEVGVSDGTNLVKQTISVTVTNVNEPPSITSAASVNVAENGTAALTASATDPEQNSLTYSLSGGTDAGLFNIDSTSGAVSFKSAPDFENPADANHNNVYLLQVQANDGTNAVTQNVQIVVGNVDESPTINSANAVSTPENSTAVLTVTANDPEGHSLLYGITGGADQARFSLNFLTGALSFVSPPNFEHPTDANGDNVYEVQIGVSDGTHLVTQNISVTVTDVHETVTISLPTKGGNFKTLLLNGQIHLRSSLGKELIAPVNVTSGADVRFVGSNAADRLTLDRSWSRFAGSFTFNGNGGHDLLDAHAVSLGVSFNGGDGNDSLIGGSGDDTADGGAGLDSLSGGDGDDSLAGGNDNDKIFGGTGSDTLTGGAGNDSISGGDDDDSLSGGDGNDTLTGDAGNDTITGDAGADLINGGDDDDLLFGNAGNDSIDGGTGDDVLDGGDDHDKLLGSDGNDSIRGGNGNDSLSGGTGNDLLTGSAGNDSINGDAGIDTLLGDAGNDTLNGGADLDTINGVITGPSKDTISDATKTIDSSFVFDFDALLAELL